MATFILTEEQVKAYTEAKDILSELVYANDINRNKVNLTYDSSSKTRHTDNINRLDKIKTDKMEKADADTYEVPLKGGMISYNITSIKGSEVMHYFKYYWDSKKAKMTIGKDEYEMQMKDEEFKKFMAFFKRKVWAVIKHCIQGYQASGEKFKPVGVSILPVKSSSNFNEKMAEILSTSGINGLPCQVINSSIFEKDISNLEKDEEFISKNQDYYNSKYYIDKNHEGDNSTVGDHVDSNIRRIKKLDSVRDMAKNLDALSSKLITMYYRYNVVQKSGNEKTLSIATNALVDVYKKYYDQYEQICDELRDSYTDANGETKSIQAAKIVQQIKSTKGPSVAKRSKAIWKVVKPYLSNMVSPITGEAYKSANVYQYKEIPFQIKKLMDPIRMAMKNMYQPNKDEELVKAEVEKTKGTVFVVFDDNISGGATLSDICYQASRIGIKHIIPITFGEMAKKTSEPRQPAINLPRDEEGKYRFSAY